MKILLRLVCLAFVVVGATGCESTRWNWLKRDTPNDTTAKPGGPASSANLLAYLNDNAKRIKTFRVDDLSIDATMGNQPIGLQGRIYAEKPSDTPEAAPNFRMKVTALGKDEVDIGSNAQEFWFWAAKNPDPYQYFCSYKNLRDGRVKMMPLPIQPEWVMETLGMGPYGPANKYTLEQDAHNFKLVEKTKSPQGYPVRKVIVINRKEVKSPQPQVSAFLLLDDATGNEICSAHITSTHVDRQTGAIIPYKMELRMPTQKMKMVLKMDGAAVNGQMQGTAFTRPQMTNVEPFNLATGRTEPWMQRAGGFGGK